MTARIFAVTVLLALPVVSAAQPASPTTLPQIDRYVYADFLLTQPNLTTMSLAADLYIYRYDVNDRVYNADDIGEAYHLQNKYAGEPSGAAFVGQIESTVRNAMRSTLQDSFGSAAVVSAVVADVDETTLRQPAGNPYDPPVKIKVTANVARPRSDVGLGSLSDAAVGAAFASGATVTADFTLKADTGYMIEYTIQAPASPAGLRFLSGPDVSADGASLVALVDNGAGRSPSRDVSARLADATATAPTAEDIRSTIDVAMGEIAKGAAGIPITVTIAAEVRALDVGARFPGVLPSKVKLAFLNAEGIRALRQTGAIKDADVARANENILGGIRDDVSRAFGPGATVTGGLSTEDLAQTATVPYGAEPPVRFLASARTTYTIEGADADDVDLALRIGGTAEVDLELFAANGRATSYSIHPPPVGEFTKATGGAVTAAGQTATFNVPAGATQHPVSISIRGRDVPTFTKESAGIDIVVDLKDLDVTLGQAAGGDFGNLLIDLTVTGKLGVIELPEELRGALPEDLDLDFLSSDALRLLLDRGHVSEKNLTELEDKLLDQVAQKLGDALGGTIPVEGGLDRASLAANLVSTPVSGDKPILFKATAKIAKPLAGGAVQPQGAIALYTQTLPLTLPRIEGLDTLYTVILPRGLAVTDVTATGAEREVGKSSDGRDQFTVRPTRESAEVSVSMAVTPTFVLAKFWPVVLLAVLLLVLIVGTPIALVVRSRGKKRKAAAKAKK